MKTTGGESNRPAASPWGSPKLAVAVATGVDSQRRSESIGRPLIMAEGSLEAIKWFALGLMVCDHINKFLYSETLPVVFEEARIAMPLFGFVLAYNLARPGALASGMHGRMMYRLLMAGLAATPVCIALNSGLVTGNAWWPLNILFTLLLVVALAYLFERGGAACYLLAAGIFIFGGAFVEYLWMGVLCCLGAWQFCRQASLSRFLLWFLGTLSLTAVNGNAYALAVIPIALLAGRLTFHVPRLKWMFYAFYPVHLLLILSLRWGFQT